MVKRKLHHVGIVIQTEEAAREFMALAGLEEEYNGYVPEYRTLCIFCKGSDASQVELVIPNGGKLAEYNGGKPGIHHIAFCVDDWEGLQAEMAAKGIQLLDATPVKGAGEFTVNFARPKTMGGILVEFVKGEKN
jgi:lactoylglutathione lyase/methylmalonyl-CoA/ethylmalonyl-CoA epimerase